MFKNTDLKGPVRYSKSYLSIEEKFLQYLLWVESLIFFLVVIYHENTTQHNFSVPR